MYMDHDPNTALLLLSPTGKQTPLDNGRVPIAPQSILIDARISICGPPQSSHRDNFVRLSCRTEGSNRARRLCCIATGARS